jgi:hypothetical protein
MLSKLQKPHLSTLFFALALNACASLPPPVSDLTDAQAQIDKVRSKNVAEHAPIEAQAAEEKWLLAQAASTSKDYKNAARLAQQAHTDAELALAKARRASARLAAQTQADENARLRSELLIPGASP